MAFSTMLQLPSFNMHLTIPLKLKLHCLRAPRAILHEEMGAALKLPECSTHAAGVESGTLGPSFWEKIPVYSKVAADEFLSYRWQVSKSVRSKEQVEAFLQGVLPDEKDLRDDILAGIDRATMSVALTPYVLSCINWQNASDDPIRKQFLPLDSARLPDHPMARLDAMTEQLQSPLPGLVHRYPDKVCLLSTTVCPIYCRFCLRSYFVGAETNMVKKKGFTKSNHSRWEDAFEYINANSSIEDVTISGGDMFFLATDDVEYIGTKLLSIPHIQRIRFGTRGLTAAPMRVLSDHAWRDVMCNLVERGRETGKSVSIHLHFNHPNEITWITQLAALMLFQHGVPLRNQSVILRGVNDNVETMSTLIKKLSSINVHPYYVYQMDMITGVEDLRTPLSTILHLEKHVQGLTAGFNVPKFIINLPSGGGKQLANLHETYDPMRGISTFTSPLVTKGVVHTYYDPLHALSPKIQQEWLSSHLP